MGASVLLAALPKSFVREMWACFSLPFISPTLVRPEGNRRGSHEQAEFFSHDALGRMVWSGVRRESPLLFGALVSRFPDQTEERNQTRNKSGEESPHSRPDFHLAAGLTS
jgi:hypothetical protein